MRPEFNATSPESDTSRNKAMTEMVDRTYAVVEFDSSGVILRANAGFLEATGYTMNEIVGQNHSMFVDAEHARSETYAQFWKTLSSGAASHGVYPRVTKAGKKIWLQASYAPVFNDEGAVTSVIELASDVTSRRLLINAVSDGLDAVARGDLKPRIQSEPDHELHDLAQRFNAALDALLAVFRVVGDVASGLDKAAADVRTRANEAAETALRNAASFEETSAEVEMVAQSVSATSENAGEALRNTQDAAEIVDVGAAAMARALEATIEMRKSAKEMSGINDVIDSIAFQTNLLALNAGIEAARAGQSGAGFAVVATEIRNLAGRSQDASSQIQALIANSVSQAGTTENYVNESGDTLKDVQDKSRLVTETMAQISSEASEQARRVEMINSVVRDLALSSERDSHNASENQGSAEMLATYSDRLTEELRRFRVGA